MSISLKKKLEDTERAVADQRELLDRMRKREAEAIFARDQMAKTVTEVQDQFAELKERLQTAETNLAHVEGYLARVREDDEVREGLIEIGNEDEKQLVPKRKSRLHLPQYGCASAGHIDHPSHWSSIETSPKRKHWTSY